jgi:hypothetical protein
MECEHCLISKLKLRWMAALSPGMGMGGLGGECECHWWLRTSNIHSMAGPSS